MSNIRNLSLARRAHTLIGAAIDNSVKQHPCLLAPDVMERSQDRSDYDDLDALKFAAHELENRMNALGDAINREERDLMRRSDEPGFYPTDEDVELAKLRISQGYGHKWMRKVLEAASGN